MTTQYPTSDDAARPPARYPFRVGQRVRGGMAGIVRALRGPYSVTVERERDGQLIITTTTDLELDDATAEAP